MARRHGPVKRLLIAPALLVAALIIGLHLLHTDAPTAANDAFELRADIPRVGSGPERCSRGQSAPRPEAPVVEPDARITSSMVFACPAAFDGVRVTYVGEVVGDLLHRDGGAWALVNDDDYALGVGPLPAHRDYRGTNSGLSVWIPDDQLAQLTGPGRPQRRGDIVRIDGVLHRADRADGGGLTLRGDRVRIVAPATDLSEPFNGGQALFAALASVAAAALWAVRRRALRR